MTELERLSAVDAIRSVMARYVYYADHAEYENLAGLFTQGGTFRSKNVQGEDWVVMNGRQQIIEIISNSVGTAKVIHHLFSYETEILSENTAKSVINMEDILIRPEDGELPEDPAMAFKTMHGYGHYRGDFVKINGIWYIDTLVQTRLKIDFLF